MSRRSPHPQHDDVGAALLLAIGFVLMIGAISAGLASLATSSLNNRDSLEFTRNRQYSADGAIELAIADVRGRLDRGELTCSTPGGFTRDSLNGIDIRVDWTNACGVVQSSDGTVVAQRNVTFSACEDTGGKCADANIVIRAQVNFEQAASAVTKTYVQSWSVNR